MHSRVHIESGELVIIYLSRDNIISVIVTPGLVLHNKYGRYLHDDMIGQKYGAKMTSPSPNSGYIHLLRPTPELWTLSLPHRTQILYSPDISYISMKLGIRPGIRVIEAGTGSGSMTHALARSIGSHGVLYSYEYHLQRYEKAKEEFDLHHLDNVKLSHRNVCKDGFGNVTGVEAVFLDLPAPWDAIQSARDTLKNDTITKICCFSPCLEQVLKTVTTLRSEGFENIYTQEVLTRHHELPLQPPTSTSALASISATIERLRLHEKRKAERRRIQMLNAREKAQKQKDAAVAAEAGTRPQEPPSSPALEAQSNPLKRAPETVPNGTADGQSQADDLEPASKRLRQSANDSETAAVEEDESNEVTTKVWIEPETSSSALLSKPYQEMRGHTSYLTFASYYPASIRAVNGTAEAQATTKASAPASGLETPADEGGSEYGSDGLDEVMGTLTEDEIRALTGEE